MRTLFFILALANAAMFAYAWFGSAARADGDAQIMSQQLNPGKIRLLQPEQVSALRHKTEPTKTVAAVAKVCLEWGAFAGNDVARAKKALAPLELGSRLTQRTQEEVAGFWVHIAPLASRQAAAQKAAELKHLGVEDYFVVTEDSKWRNAVSLGMFKTEGAAKARLAALRAKGVRTASITERGAQTGKTYFMVRDADPGLVAKLNVLKQEFAGSELSKCASENKNG